MTTTPTRATRLADAGLPGAAFARSDTGDSLAVAAILELADAVAEVRHERCDQIAPMTTVEIQAIVRRLQTPPGPSAATIADGNVGMVRGA